MSGYPSQRGRIWAYVGFLSLFFFMLVIVSDWYLIPALKDFNEVDATGKKLLSTHALLLMSVILVLLLLCLMLLFRLGRFFFPPPTSPQSKTNYTDAWAESGKRMRTPKE